MPAGVDTRSGPAPPQSLALTEGFTASLAGAMDGKGGGTSFRTPTGDLDWDEIWRRMPRPIEAPRVSGITPAARKHEDIGEVGRAPIQPTAGSLAADKRGSSLVGAPVALRPESARGSDGATAPPTPQAAQQEVRRSLALAAPATFGDSALQGGGTRGAKTVSVAGPFGSGQAGTVATAGLLGSKGSRVDPGDLVRVEGRRDGAPPLAAQLAGAARAANVARDGAEALEAQSRRDEEDHAALRLEAEKAAIPPEPLSEMSPLAVRRLEDERLALATRAVGSGLAAMRASRQASALAAEADASEASAFRLMTLWLAQDPGPMEGAELFSAMIDASYAPEPHLRDGTARVLPPPRDPVAPPATRPAARACCASCAAGSHEGHGVAAAPRGGCGCGSKPEAKRPPEHWSGGPIGPDSPAKPTNGPPKSAPRPTPLPAAIVPDTAVMRCGEGPVLRPLNSFVDCAWPDLAPPPEGGRPIAEPPQALAPAARAAVAPRPGADRSPIARATPRPAAAADGGGALCRPRAGVRLPVFSWTPLCPAPVHHADFDGASVVMVAPPQGHQGGGASETYRPPRQCHCECYCKFGGPGVDLTVTDTPTREAPTDGADGSARVAAVPPQGPLPPGRLPIGGCIQPMDAVIGTAGRSPPLMAGQCPPLTPPLHSPMTTRFELEPLAGVARETLVGTQRLAPILGPGTDDA